jgi:hypothetical protein
VNGARIPKLFQRARRLRRVSLGVWLVVGLIAWCLGYVLQYAREYAPLVLVPLRGIEIDIRGPVQSYCTVHRKAATPPAVTDLRTREFVVRVVAWSPQSPPLINAALREHWFELTGGTRAPLLEPRQWRPIEQTPARFWHVSTNRTLLLLGRGVQRETRLIHESHVRLCPAGAY